MAGTEKLAMEKVLMESIQEMVFIVKVDENSNFFYEFFNQEAMRQTGFDNSSLGKSLLEAHSPEVGKRLEDHCRKVIESGEKLSIEDTYKRSSGDSHCYQLALTPFLNEQQTCTHISAIVKDITEDKKVQQEADETWRHLKESCSRYSSLYENNTDAVFAFGLDGLILEGNSAAEKLSGFRIDELKGKRFLDYVAAEDPKRFKIYLEQALTTPLEDNRIRFSTRTGSQVGCLIKLVPIIQGEERVGMYAILKDMTELDKMIGKFVESENLFRIIAENAHDVIVLLNNEGQFLYISPSCLNVYGSNPEEIEAVPLLSLVHSDDHEELEKKLAESILTGNPCKMQLRVRHKTKDWIWSELLGTPVFDEDGKFIHKVLILRDISQQKDYESRLQFFAYHDSLTGLPNRRMLKEVMVKHVEQNQEFAVMILDIDDFKDINDRWGHEVGDQVIQEFAQRLARNIGEDDFAARLGGDEFVILYKGYLTSDEAIKMAALIRQSMEMPWEVENADLMITTSIGITLASAEESDPSAILKKADHALYDAKNSGKNNYQLNR